MNQKAYIINATWGEYDYCTRIPMFVCYMQIEADMFVDALNNKETHYWEKVTSYFAKNYGMNYRIPDDIGFSYEEIDVLTLIQHHPST